MKKEKRCKRMYVPKDVCYIKFCREKHKKIKYSFDGTTLHETKKGKIKIEGRMLQTIRNEEVIIDFDKNNKIIGIELLGHKKCKKPCQEQ